uniref:Uncharacterized protein n=1 Tax=Myoviridae sp. ctLYR7 TaxID=2827679 RepID=A0A8S5RX11_9CAUD|nr:MAG TPA: hypothetical protein [Myoviridae sp. ctLYR7]DAJ60677.1 MAG TPA: hypothetical protein [Caudoviricetes sp.]DAT22411.1 MAG TPA: hypothetical protein [Caudoviricetes sp.]
MGIKGYAAAQGERLLEIAKPIFPTRRDWFF